MHHCPTECDSRCQLQLSSSLTSGRWLAMVLLIFATGCGSRDGVQLVPVQGHVTLDGQPLDRATVTFQPADGRPSVGITDAKGFYRMQYTATRPGALLGPHSVSISSEVRGTTNEATGESIPGRKEILPLRYRDNSELTAVVERGKKAYDFALKSN